MLVRILNTLRSRIWDIVFFLFSDGSKSTVCQYGICQKEVLLQGMAEEKNVKMGMRNLKYNVLAEEVCHALHDVHLVARVSGHS